jgi:hypothetical protein
MSTSFFPGSASTVGDKYAWRSLKPNRHERRRVRHQIRNGRRVAAERAFGGARLYMAGLVPTLVAAALSSGSTVKYVMAAVTILQAKDRILEEEVLTGEVSLLAAAAKAKPIVTALKAYAGMDVEAKSIFLRKCGMDQMLNDLAMAEARGSSIPVASFSTMS